MKARRNEEENELRKKNQKKIGKVTRKKRKDKKRRIDNYNPVIFDTNMAVLIKYAIMLD